MSPTIFRDGSFRFYFFSRAEARMHVYVQCPDGEAEPWLEPTIALAHNYGLFGQQVRAAQQLVEARADEIRSAWRKHFAS
jgi:Domain of unknown function (DUF4160)